MNIKKKVVDVCLVWFAWLIAAVFSQEAWSFLWFVRGKGPEILRSSEIVAFPQNYIENLLSHLEFQDVGSDDWQQHLPQCRLHVDCMCIGLAALHRSAFCSPNFFDGKVESEACLRSLTCWQNANASGCLVCPKSCSHIIGLIRLNTSEASVSQCKFMWGCTVNQAQSWQTFFTWCDFAWRITLTWSNPDVKESWVSVAQLQKLVLKKPHTC